MSYARLAMTSEVLGAAYLLTLCLFLAWWRRLP